MVFDDDGSDVTWEDFDLCDLSKITLKYNRKTKVVSADTEQFGWRAFAGRRRQTHTSVHDAGAVFLPSSLGSGRHIFLC